MVDIHYVTDDEPPVFEGLGRISPEELTRRVSKLKAEIEKAFLTGTTTPIKALVNFHLKAASHYARAWDKHGRLNSEPQVNN